MTGLLRFLDARMRIAVLLILAAAVLVPVLALTPTSFPLHLPAYLVPLFGKYLCYAILAVALAVTAVPTALATWPHRTERVEDGGLAAARTYCDALAPGDVVLAVDDWAVNHWTQITRGMCGVPSIATTGRLRDDPQQVRAAAERLDERVRERGGRLLLVAHRERASLDDIGATDVRTVLDTTLMEDPHVLTTRPERLDPLHLTVWTGRVAR